MHKSFNKLGSIEIEGNSFKYRIATQEINTENPDDIEKDIKRKIQSIENAEIFLLPYDIKTVNRYMVLYYDLTNYSGFDYLRELTLKEKLPYFLSLIQIAKTGQKSIKILWNKTNFVVDRYEQAVKVLLFETDYLRVYEDYDCFKMVVDFMVYSMTTLNKVIGLPKRNDFIDPSDENLEFVEKIFRLDNLDDILMYIETLMIDLEEKEIEEEQALKKKKLFKNSPISLNKAPEKKRKLDGTRNYNQSSKKKKKKSDDKNKKMMKIGILFFVASMLIYLLLPVLIPKKSDEPKQTVVSEKELKNTDSYFKDTGKYNDKLVSAYRKAYNSQYSDAYELLAKIPKDELSSTDVSMVIKVYDQANKISQLLDEVPSLASNIVSYLLTEDQSDQTEKLADINKKMKTKNPYIEFEVSYSSGEYKKVLALKDKLEMNGRREQQVIDAYLALGKIADARKFANDSGDPDLIKQVDSYND
ncbi:MULTISPECIES: hypothetical protein [Bacillus]|uniref:hypothetical protein n=1 Tax=Bacillus TaxID=1386 RepID=UPI002E1B6C43|nr:hypothetical protein [Bacillus velezensis]